MFYFDDDDDYGENVAPPPSAWAIVGLLILVGLIIFILAGCSAQGSHNANLDFHFLDGGGRRGR